MVVGNSDVSGFGEVMVTMAKRKRAALVGLVGVVLLLLTVYAWAARQERVSEPVVVTTTEVVQLPPVEEPSSLRVERNGPTVRLEGTVQTMSEREALVAAVTSSGFDADAAITVSAEVTDSDTRLLAVLLPPLLDGTEGGELSLVDGTVTLTGEALDPVEADELAAAIGAAVAGGLTVDDRTTVRVLPEAVQIVALQEEIEQIFDLARSIDGQSPNFAVSLDGLSSGATATLDRVVVAMRRYPLPHADIIGHTDSIGSEEANQALSDERAQAVLEYLVGGGVGEARLTAVGRGESEPIADNGDETGRAENRRVDFLVKSSQS